MIHIEEPLGFVPDFEAVGIFPEVGDKILQLLRAPDRKWGSPAGKIEGKENALTAAIRELKEETGIIVSGKQLQFVQKYFVEYPVTKFTYAVFRLPFLYAPEIVLSYEHVAYTWIPVNFASSLDLMMDQLECIKLVYNLSKPIIEQASM